MEVRELGDSSIAVLRRKLEHLAAEFREMAAIDATLPPARRRSAGMLVALRARVSSLHDSLRGAEPGKPDTQRKHGREGTWGYVDVELGAGRNIKNNKITN